MERESGIGSGEERAPPVRVPLNSRRLKAGHLRRIAAALDMPIAASADELRQMIDGNLTEEGKDTPNVQVVLAGGPSWELCLEDEEGRFLTVAAAEEVPRQEPSEPSEQDPGEVQEADALQKELDSVTQANEALKAEVSELEQQLLDEKSRFREMWRTNCKSLAEYDNLITAKDSEIEELERQLRSHPLGPSPLSTDTHTTDSPGVQEQGETRRREEPVRPAGLRARRGKPHRWTHLLVKTPRYA